MQQPPQPTQENLVSIVSMTLSELRAERQQLVTLLADAAQEASCAPVAGWVNGPVRLREYRNVSGRTSLISRTDAVP
ncbi:hypothetical protein ALQ15_111075 [Pseudomonas syringae pv. actinidiae]|uniref:Uncharacterized protein n=1 Tax=Pseudomonas syringae pv. actinidiae TaxID=103796 RepID=A0A7Z6Y176_PSESF|nr:hypothetical protein ALQ15_111075 [Pseudomonas syringae pv. actinidiae]